MDGNDFISLAGKLVATPAADESACRTAVSRAYYGAFHVARSFLIELGFQPLGNANVHAFIQRYLNGSGNPDACRAASQLSHLHTARNKADYRLDDDEVGIRSNAMLAVERAHRVVSAVENCRADDVRDAIRQAISKYEQQIRPR